LFCQAVLELPHLGVPEQIYMCVLRVKTSSQVVGLYQHDILRTLAIASSPAAQLQTTTPAMIDMALTHACLASLPLRPRPPLTVACKPGCKPCCWGRCSATARGSRSMPRRGQGRQPPASSLERLRQEFKAARKCETSTPALLAGPPEAR